MNLASLCSSLALIQRRFNLELVEGGDTIADRLPALAWEGAMARTLVAVLAFFLLALGASPEAHAAKRVAFVVGIDAYDNLPDQQQLKKAVNDVEAVGATLVGLGYDVQKADNVGRLDFLRQWQLFLNRLEPDDEAAVFFAGHGVEIDGQNFLLPRDVPRVECGKEDAQGLRPVSRRIARSGA